MAARKRKKNKGLPPTRPRIVATFLPLLLLLLVLLARAAQLQFVDHPKLEGFMQRIQPTTIEVARTNRGIIFDRNGRELAVNVPVESIYIDPYSFKKNEKRLSQPKKD